ncbi:UNVERIFIED_CONTAM: hypothetical protein Cloal_3661 [Acetivibrio alkalicellulosi]
MSEEKNLKMWRDIVEQFKKSGQNQTQWCKNNNVNLRSFNKWYNYFKKNNKETQDWVPLKVVEDQSNTTLNIKIGNAIIEVSEGFNSKLLAEVVKVIGLTC